MPRASLGTKLLVAIIVLFLPVLALLILDFEISYRGRIESTLDGEVTSANFLASSVDFSLDQGVALAQSYALSARVQSLDAERIYPYLVEQSGLFPHYDDIAVVDAQGEGVVSVRNSPGQPTVNVADRDYFRQAMATNRPVVSNLLNSRATGNPIIVTAAPIPGPEGKPIGIVITSLSAEFLGERISEAPLPSQHAAFLVDPSGRVAAYLGTSESGVMGMDATAYIEVATVQQGKAFRGIVSRSMLGDERAIAVVPTPKHGWIVGVSMPTSSVQADNLVPVLVRLAIYLAVVIAVTLAGVVAARRVVIAPLLALVRVLTAFGRGDMGERVKIGTGDELETVAEAFNRMAERIQVREEQLRESEEQWRLVVTNSPDLVFYQDRDLRYTWLSRPVPPFTEETLGKADADLLPAEEARVLTEIKRKVIETGVGTRVEVPVTIASGTHHYDVVYEPSRDRQGQIVGISAYARDITDRKRVEEERERLLDQLETERRDLQTMIDQMPEGVFFAEAPDGRVTMANNAAKRLLGRDVPLGTPVDMETEAYGFFRPDGQPYAPQDLPISRALQGETVLRQDVVIRRPDGSAVTVMVNCAPVGTDDHPKKAIAVFQDISAMKEAERLREEFIHLISHDLRNPLTAVTGQAQWLQRLLSQRGMEREASSVAALLTSARRMNAMIQELVESARLESGRLELHKQPTDLLSLVSDVSQRVGSLEDRSRIHVEAREGMPPVAVDPDRVERALVNLITNALKYSEPGSPVVVRVERRDDEAFISVTDRGVGIPPDELYHVFERFYRAKTSKSADGLGLGLYITRLLIEAHGGRIWVESELGKGSTFHVSFPHEPLEEHSAVRH